MKWSRRRRPSLVADGLSVVEFADSLGVEATLRLVGPTDAGRPPLPTDSIVVRVHDLSTVTGPADADGSAGGPSVGDIVAGAQSAGFTPLLPSLTLAASALGADLRLAGPVCPVALDGARAANRIMAGWFGVAEVAIDADEHTAVGARHSGRGLLFSRGVDSMSILAAMTAAGSPPTHLVGLDWLDGPYAGGDQRRIWSSTAAAAAERGLPLVRMTTDARTLLDPLIGWEIAHVPVLVGPALALGAVFGAIGVSSTYPAGDPEPYGSHADLDPLWSSASVAVEHRLDVPGDRLDKVAVVAGDPWAMRWLKVCWERAGDGNCGRCRKCLMTMSMLWMVGAEDRVAVSFEAPLDVDAVRAVVGQRPLTTPRNFVDVAAALRAVADGVPVAPPIVVGGDTAEQAMARQLADAWDEVVAVGLADAAAPAHGG